MSQKCSCQSFERLEGASVPAYISAFLEEQARVARSEQRRYRCRVCASTWERREPRHEGEGKRPSLVRLTTKSEEG
ncbi:MAG TPA: hypothetical protein VGB17_12600 [Pyrinomonadaceae bacterium]|jgi:hypothetical protein